ncbi:alpha-mannosidase [Paenibacillus alginolyticus]|uniref:Alpha-mannosidase n=1 Tax=Paenibacillus alginolyticus TaxID=59839 RepID=A0ABT4GGW1_9BACL|nr:alpha-mannosidase [Paenibacillus alginolyticus]MCY9695434.1 alpha-mannosidase [Paenibacillus alginolyticus]MEC0146303.1 alpha-mannosidase [Paenibacillus alginolyticus]
MFWTVEKLHARINELEPLRYRGERAIDTFRIKLDAGGVIGDYPSEDGEWDNIRIGDRWKGRDVYYWLAADLIIPAEWKGRKVLGRFKLGQTGEGTNSGFESLLFLNGVPYQGVDSNHEEVFLHEELIGSKVQLRFRLWSGLGGYQSCREMESQLELATVCWLDEACDDLYYTAKALLETVRILDENRPERHELLSMLDQAFLLLDWSRPGSDTFYSSVARAQEQLQMALSSMPKLHSVVVQCIGHTHIDVAWLWQLKHTREKAARSFSTVLRLMEQYPEYIFLQTQPQLYEYIKSDYPQIYERIKERVREGRWEAGGAMWLEADCNLASGESLVRQLLYGTRFFREEFGVECKYLWLPDVFGYSWALPQILRKSGIESFMTTKISWNQYNRMPHDTFMWRGIDGTEVLTHFITTPDPGSSEGAFYYTYNGKVTPSSVQGIWDAYRDKALNSSLLLAYGFGDGGGGVNREMLEMRRRLDKIPGIPAVKTGRADEYFNELQQRVSNSNSYVHTWDGELYLELHRGTYTSQAYNKLMNRKLELLFRETEWLQAMSSILNVNEAAAKGESSLPLQEGWKIILRNQFHDIIPGSSIREVYEDSRAEYNEALAIGEKVWNQSVSFLAEGEHEREVLVFNSSPWEQTDIVCLPKEKAAEVEEVWLDALNRPLETQLVDGKRWVKVERIPSMGYTAIRPVEHVDTPVQKFEEITFIKLDHGLITPFYEIEWNASGQIERLYDRIENREILAEGQKGNRFDVFEDKPKGRHEAWDIDIFYTEKKQEVNCLNRIEVTDSGLLAAVVRFEWSYMESTIVQDMVVYAHSRRIDFQTHVNWNEQRKLLKVAFPLRIRATEATYDIQFGNVKRPTHWNTSWDYARFETVGHQWADLSERGYGVSLLNDCKYGYDIKDNVMRLTLIKSAMVPDPTADIGEHKFTYSLFPHPGDWYEGKTVQSAWSLNNPLTYAYGKPAKASFSLFRLSCDHVMIDAVKKAEDQDAIILRIHEFAGISGQVEILSDARVESWQECDLLERPQGDQQYNALIHVQMTPYEIKTFIVHFK